MRDEQIFFTDHALRQMENRNIDDLEVTDALLSGEIIEEYPDDKYSPSCLIYGQSTAHRPIHIVCSLPPRVRVITVYQPNPDDWMDDFRRRKP